jgi:hypothetical protein
MSHEHKYVFAALVAALALTPVLADAQSSGDIPRTAWGDPDIGGVWDYSSITPMVRPEKYGEREFLTEEEVAELENGAIERDRSAAEAPPAGRAEAGDQAGANGHSFVWGLELGTDYTEDRRTSRIIDPPNGRYPEMTEWGKADAAMRYGFSETVPADHYTDRGYGDRCMAIHGMPISPLPYNSFMQFFQTPDHVGIFSEAFGRWRIVPIDDRPHGTLKQWMGDTRGRWEGNTLVVETTNFSHYLQQAGAGRNIRSLVEKFTRVSPGVIRYEYTVDDPVKWASPWTSSITFRKTDLPVYELACHEGNYAIANILRGGRAYEGTPDEVEFEPGKICWDCEPVLPVP